MRIIGKGLLFGVAAFVGWIGGAVITAGVLAAVATQPDMDTPFWRTLMDRERARMREAGEVPNDAPFNVIRSFPIPEGSPLAPAGFLAGLDDAVRSYADDPAGAEEVAGDGAQTD